MTSSARTHTVVVYSDDAKTRAAVRQALGTRPAADLGTVEFVECTTGKALLTLVDAGGVDLVVLDGEARPTGGLGLAKQLKDEIEDCAPTLVLVARKDDAWLAKWSLADGVEMLPVDPFSFAETASRLLRHRESALPVRRAAGV
jgi:PleD family two-component response regulator